VKRNVCNFVVGLAVMLSNNLFAGEYIAIGSEITQVFNTASNTSTFGIVVRGGSGPCVDKTIYFPLSAAGGDSDIQKRAYSAALTAFTAGFKVDIHNYADSISDCKNASFIRVKK
jgi:hypothetical protein